MALDLFCSAGGVSMGLHRAGFDVVGIDIKPQPRYPFRFIQADALNPPVRLEDFDFIWASPPCQAHTSLKGMWNAKEHPDLIPATRALLQASGKPWAIENVPGAPLQFSVVLCGTMFGLGWQDAELRRHRLFETSSPLLAPVCQHKRKPRVIGVYGGHGRDRRRTVNTQDYPTSARREAMGIDWMTGAELSQAIPPAYSEFIVRGLCNSASTRNTRA
jgi:DNA (cytosine-5)-methyltransferase 1